MVEVRGLSAAATVKGVEFQHAGIFRQRKGFIQYFGQEALALRR